tara:strand:- start:293 stop:688 length:396 start_codon:yes stop_codon:yes gene_type:complete
MYQYKNKAFKYKKNILAILENKAQMALDSGDPELAFLLGNNFNNIDDPDFIKSAPFDVCKQNFMKAKYWLHKAVNKGHPDAMVVLGNAYISGLSCVAKNINLGNKLLRKAKSIYRSSPSITYMAKRMLGVK